MTSFTPPPANTTITGGSGHDSIVGGTGQRHHLLTHHRQCHGHQRLGPDSIFGGNGNDFIYLTTGNSTITGGPALTQSWADLATTSST